MKNHKFDTQRIMADAWKHAEYMAFELGGLKSQYFSYCLRKAWHAAKQPLKGTIKQIIYASDLSKEFIKTVVANMPQAEAAGVTAYRALAEEAINAVDFFSGYAGQLIDELLKVNKRNCAAIQNLITSLK